MTMSDPAGRRATGTDVWVQLFGVQPPEPGDPFSAAALDFAYAEVWSRSGLARHDRILLSLACLAADTAEAQLKALVRATLDTHELTLDELHEAMLHLAVYIGFPPLTSTMRNALVTAAEERGLQVSPPQDAVPPERRRAVGLQWYAAASGRPPAPPEDPLRAAAMDFVAAEVWQRAGLAARDRRLLTIAVLVRSSLRAELRMHIRNALAGEFTITQLEEAALHLAVYLGFPRAAVMQAVINEIGAET